MTTQIVFDHDRRESLRRTYNAARVNGDDEFEFGGETFSVDYAKYVLEYLDLKMEQPER